MSVSASTHHNGVSMEASAWSHDAVNVPANPTARKLVEDAAAKEYH